MLAERKNWILPILVAFFFASSYIAGKYTTYDAGALFTTFLRTMFALLFLSLLIFKTGKASLKIEKKDFVKFILLGSFGPVGFYYFFFTSLKYALVVNSGIINTLNPVLVAVLAAIFLRERLGPRSYTGVILAFIGVLFLMLDGKPANLLSLNFNTGDLIMLLAVLCRVIYTLLIKNLSARYRSFTLTFYATLTGAVILCALSIIEGNLSTFSNISTRSFVSIAYMGIFVSGIGYLCYNSSVKTIGPTKTSCMVQSLVPVFTAAMAYLFFEEQINSVFLISLVFILTGINLVMRKRKKSTWQVWGKIFQR